MAVRKYELLMILDPVRTEEQNEELLTKIDELVKKFGGTPDSRNLIGKRRLAYPISKRRDGTYLAVLYDSETDSLLHREMDLLLKYDEGVLRHLVTQAVVGKSKGDISRLPEERPRFMDRGGPRGPRGDRGDRGDRGGDRGDRGGDRYERPAAPVPAAATATAPPAPEAAPPAPESGASS